MMTNIDLPTEFFPAITVSIDYSSTEEFYPIIIYGFDGNEIYYKETNIYLMRDQESITSIAEIGEYICNIFTNVDDKN